MKPLIALYALPEQEAMAIKDGLANIATTVSSKEPLTSETMRPDCSVIVILPSTTITDIILEKLPNLRAIISLSAGLDHVGFDSSRYPAVKVINNPTFSVPSVSEYVVGCIFQTYYESYWADPTSMSMVTLFRPTDKHQVSRRSKVRLWHHSASHFLQIASSEAFFIC